METDAPEQIRTVDRTITIKLPVKLDDYLCVLAKALNRSVESILLEELYSNMENFFQGGFADAWKDEIADLELETGKKLEEQVSQVAAIVLDC